MDDLIYYYPTDHQKHAEPGHPERPDRVEVIRSSLVHQNRWAPYPKIDPVGIPEDVLYAVHTPEYLERLKRVCSLGQHYDMDTYTTPASYDLALKSAGGAAVLAQNVWQRRSRRGFALTRPPGHHATGNRAMGFCLINNIALAAEYLIQKEAAKRLAIVDLDLHHGNGTQDIFYHRGDVLYISTHQFPHYPGSGELDEIGSGEGKGATANFPLLAFSGDQAFRTVMDELILPLLSRFNPEMILISYGFDPHWRDPLGNLRLSAQTYGELISSLAKWADDHCHGRIVLVLEGGYDLEAAGVCSLAIIAALLGVAWQDPIGPCPSPEGTAWQGMVQRAKLLWAL